MGRGTTVCVEETEKMSQNSRYPYKYTHNTVEYKLNDFDKYDKNILSY